MKMEAVFCSCGREIKGVAELQAENKRLKMHFDSLASLVIFNHPETWEAHLEDVKKALHVSQALQEKH